MPFLGEIPLQLQIREQADGGRPTAAVSPDSEAGRAYRAIADKVAMLHEGVIRWHGPVAEIDTADDPYLRQFVTGAAEGPIAAVR